MFFDSGSYFVSVLNFGNRYLLIERLGLIFVILAYALLVVSLSKEKTADSHG